MALSREEVLKIANLARLEFKDEEIEKFQHELNDILKYIDILGELDTSNVEPLLQTNEMQNVLREDTVKESLSPELATKNAPQSEDGTFIVPKVVG
jgi:aspartyl-tRNA(Asn)/glutamyl-tRNA(Gln) amidotransferase subunit C